MKRTFLTIGNATALSVAAIFALTHAQAGETVSPQSAAVQLAASAIDGVLEDVSRSVQAVGAEFATITAATPAAVPDMAIWEGRARHDGKTTGYNTWSAGAPEPAFQSGHLGLYSYGDPEGGPQRAAGLYALRDLTPVLRAAYASFDFAWVYVTTADNLMAIYPFVGLKAATENAMPVDQIYYTAADFQGHATGWTPPYLDLVGAGMMVTASWPIYSGDKLLGVASRDITLDELSREVLEHLSKGTGATAVIVDPTGMAIATSDPELAGELKAVNTRAGSAVLYYRTPEGLASIAEPKAVPSQSPWIDKAVEQVLQSGIADTLTMDERSVFAAKIAQTGWYVILAESGV